MTTVICIAVSVIIYTDSRYGWLTGSR